MCDAESMFLLRTMKSLEKKGYPITYSLIDEIDFQSSIKQSNLKDS